MIVDDSDDLLPSRPRCLDHRLGLDRDSESFHLSESDPWLLHLAAPSPQVEYGSCGTAFRSRPSSTGASPCTCVDTASD